MKLSYSVACLLGSIAEAEALCLGVPMAIAVVDGKGGLLFFGRMDGTLPASTEIAMAKAFTAAALRMATHEVGRLAQPGGVLYGIQHTHGGKIVLFGGGLPLRLQGKVVGGIGISGGTVEEDIQVAEPVVKALAQMESWSEGLGNLVPASSGAESWFLRLHGTLERVVNDMGVNLSHGDLSILRGAIILSCGEDL
ncbi:MAG: heme-binding protein [Deltaproteobacteria bacterium]|nr:MAG: heme-binding protein [Deltaproteobacteria bacterium]